MFEVFHGAISRNASLQDIATKSKEYVCCIPHTFELVETTLSDFFSSEVSIPSYKNVMKALTGESSGRKSRKRKVFY